MILAAGEGRRLAPLTETCPKPLLVYQGETLIERHLGALARAGVSDAVINTFHLADQIESRLGNENAGVDITWSREETLLETGGGIRNALPLLGNDVFLLVNGDILTDFPFTSLLGPLPPDVDVHLVLVDTPANRDAGDFGLVGGRLTRERRDLVYSGIAVISPGLFRDSPSGAFSVRDLLFRAAALGRATGEHYHGEWSDVGTPDVVAALGITVT